MLKCEYVIVLDDDIKLHPGTIRAWVEELEGGLTSTRDATRSSSRCDCACTGRRGGTSPALPSRRCAARAACPGTLWRCAVPHALKTPRVFFFGLASSVRAK